MLGMSERAFRGWRKRWERYTRAIGITDRRRVLHSLWHGFKDACHRAWIEEEVHDAITGPVTAFIGLVRELLVRTMGGLEKLRGGLIGGTSLNGRLRTLVLVTCLDDGISDRAR